MKKLKIEYELYEDQYLKNQSLINIDKEKSKNQFLINIEMLDVYFPYKPYDCQIKYMTKGIQFFSILVIQCLEFGKGSFSSLESPTGTGKTLCLLCASLAWLKYKREKYAYNFLRKPMIFYSSRTHSQLDNVIEELKKTCYIVNSTTLASMERFCINPHVNDSRKEVSIYTRCKIATNLNKKDSNYKENNREYNKNNYCNYKDRIDLLDMKKYNNLDIEELNKFGQKENFCPFYFQREKKEKSDIIFLPYNYIFKKRLLKFLELDLDNNILIIDEAHNIEKVSEDSYSFDLNISQIEKLLDDFKLPDIENIEQDEKGYERYLKQQNFKNSLDNSLISKHRKILNDLKFYLNKQDLKKGEWPNIGKELSQKEFFKILFQENNINEYKNMNSLENNFFCEMQKITNIEEGLWENFSKGTILSEYINFLTDAREVYINIKRTNKNSNVWKFKL